jgi:chaperonin GroES
LKTTVLLDRVLVKKTEAKTSTSSGLVIASGLDNPQDEGVVVAVGEGRLTSKDILVPLAVKIDDRVVFPKGAGIPVKIDGEELIVLREHEIYGVLEE